MELAKGYTATEKSVLALPIVERAKYHIKKMSNLDSNQKRSYLSDLKARGLLSENLYNEIVKQLK